jgi:hypothetical protein
VDADRLYLLRGGGVELRETALLQTSTVLQLLWLYFSDMNLTVLRQNVA